MKCCICERDIEKHRDSDGKIIWGGGNNAMPVVDPSDTQHARCCDACDCLIVIPARMNMSWIAAFTFGKMLLHQRKNPPTFPPIPGGEEE